MQKRLERIPSRETRRLVNAAGRAVQLAASGALADGHAELVAGLVRAERFRAEGQPWGASLVRGYVMAIDGYCACFGVAMEPAG